ncbi:hypothetical protein SDC9_166232 [bioreactor metagenome]|uniref:Uncharacterized protein n=1 Tax=bioreactor metagenome TaxID=1076179 RepID=A0A645FWK7_9ZZZZ
MRHIRLFFRKNLELLLIQVFLGFARYRYLRAEGLSNQHTGAGRPFDLISVKYKTGFVSFGGADERKRWSGISRARFNDHSVGGQYPMVPCLAALGRLHHGERHAILVAAAGVQMLQFNKDISAGFFAYFV